MDTHGGWGKEEEGNEVEEEKLFLRISGYNIQMPC